MAVGTDADTESIAETDTVDAYVARLADGLDSHPDCVIKGAFSRSLLERIPAVPAGLPGPLGELVEHPPLISAWIPEVHHQGLIVAVVERVYAGDREAFLEMMTGMQRDLLGRKIYAPLLQWVDPARLLHQAAKRWSNFHRGTSLEVERIDDDGARLSIVHPAALYSGAGCDALAGGFRAAVEAGRTAHADVVVAARTPTRTTFRAAWR